MRALVVLPECNERLLEALNEAVLRLASMFLQHLPYSAGAPAGSAEVLAALFDVGKRAQWNPVWREGLMRSMVNHRMLELIPCCYSKFVDNFRLAGEAAAYEEALFQQLSGPSVLKAVMLCCGQLVPFHLRQSVCGHPLALRFHSGPLFDLLSRMPPSQAVPSLAEAALSGGIVPEQKVNGTVRLLAQALSEGENQFKNLLVDLQLLFRGRPDPDFAQTFAQL